MKENEEITNLERFELLIEDCKGHRELYGESSVGEYDIEIMQHILSDYKRVLEMNEVLLKENEELNLKYYMLYTGKIENLKAQEVKIKSQVIPVQKVKNKIEELKKNLYTVEHYETVGAINVLQELLEGRK